MKKLKDTPEPNGNGTLLDNTVAMHGSASSSFHLSRNYPIISAGGRNLGFTNSPCGFRTVSTPSVHD